MEKGKAVEVAVPAMPKIPAFSGKDAYLWVTRVDQYFHANPTINDRDKLQAVVGALEETASKWFHLYWKKYTATALTWPAIKNAVVHRFQPEAVYNPLLVLLNIRQIGTLAEYRDMFETLITHSEPLRSSQLTLGDEMSRAIFLNGLREDLKAKLRLRDVKSLSELMCMAQLIEDGQWAKDQDIGFGPKLMKFWGEIFGRKVVMLVGSGASDSMISSRVVKELGLLVCESDELFVFADGPPVKSEGVCRGVIVKVHEDLQMTHDFFVFDNLVGNEDVVLGFDWLQRLGTVSTNYRTLTMSFAVAGTAITLKGNPSLTLPDQIKIPLMRRLTI